ncbi:MAG: hypothetical protein ACR2PL_02380, partial [Dehalococcoidia bacterium]
MLYTTGGMSAMLRQASTDDQLECLWLHGRHQNPPYADLVALAVSVVDPSLPAVKPDWADLIIIGLGVVAATIGPIAFQQRDVLEASRSGVWGFNSAPRATSPIRDSLHQWLRE